MQNRKCHAIHVSFPWVRRRSTSGAANMVKSGEFLWFVALSDDDSAIVSGFCHGNVWLFGRPRTTTYYIGHYLFVFPSLLFP